jgi:predicted aldo/keto reductase-like oxidoreductase
MTELKSEQIMRDIEWYIDHGVPYIDAIVDYATREGLEIEVVGEIIRRSPVLKSKIYDEAEKLNMVERTARLPV